MRELHLGQCDGGLTIDSPRGTRQITTLRKLAMHAPIQKLKNPIIKYRLSILQLQLKTSPSPSLSLELASHHHRHRVLRIKALVAKLVNKFADRHIDTETDRDFVNNLGIPDAFGDHLH